MGSSLAVTGVANLNNSLNVAGPSALNATLAVAGAANLNNTLAVAGAANLNSSLAVTGAAALGSTLAVTGAATFQNNVTVNGNLTVLGNQTAIDTVSLQVKDNAVLIADGNVTDTIQSGIMVQYQPTGASAPKYAGVKRLPVSGSTGGEFVFFKDAADKIAEPSSGGSSSGGSSASSSVAGAWIEYDLATPSVINNYACAWGYSDSSINHMQSWTLLGSNDKTTWYFMDSQSDYISTAAHRNSGSGNVSDQQFFTIATPASYSYIRFVIQKLTLSSSNQSAASGVEVSAIILRDSSNNFILATFNNTYSSELGSSYQGANVASVTSNTYNIVAHTVGYGGVFSPSNIYNGPNNTYIGTTNNAYNAAIASSPAPAADVYASIIAESFNCASDINLKNNIVVLDGALDKLDAMRGVYHNWIDENQSQDRQIGVIAQEVQSVYPELVSVGGNGYLSVNYPKLTAVLLQSIKELKAMVLALADK
jgi:hypothetical protein